jgi:multisubunit Na+/H+ antiporter MnhB subunit
MWFETVLAIGMVTSAVFALYLKETIASILSLSTMLILLSILYFDLGAPFAAIFQLALGTGTAAIFLLAGDTLTKRNDARTSQRTQILAFIASVILCIPIIIGNVATEFLGSSLDLSISNILWQLREVDVLAQGLVVLAAAIGVAIILKEEWR